MFKNIFSFKIISSFKIVFAILSVSILSSCFYLKHPKVNVDAAVAAIAGPKDPFRNKDFSKIDFTKKYGLKKDYTGTYIKYDHYGFLYHKKRPLVEITLKNGVAQGIWKTTRYGYVNTVHEYEMKDNTLIKHTFFNSLPNGAPYNKHEQYYKVDENGVSHSYETLLYGPTTQEVYTIIPIKNAKKNGEEKSFWGIGNRGIYYRSMYKDGKQNGMSKYYYNNGQLKYKVNYVNDEKEGELVQYYESGKLKHRVNYKNGDKHGLFRYWYENGQLKSIFKENNNKTIGAYKGFYDDGSLRIYTIYKNDKAVNITNFKPEDKAKDTYPPIK